MTGQMDMPAISCVDVTKIYESGAVALQGLTLAIERGMSFGLLGENGAGKSTLVRLVMGFLFPTSGTLRVLGETEVQRAHGHVGYLHERPYTELRFTGFRYLTYMAELAGLWGVMKRERVAAVLELVDLSEAAQKRMDTHSKGMLQRLSIAQALLTDPELLVLDEPTNGLDPYSQWKIRQILGELRRQGKTMLICSHYLPEVETLCDTIGILQYGRLVQYGAVTKLLHEQNAVEIVLAGEMLAGEVVTRLGIAGLVLSMENNTLRIPASAQDEALAALVGAEIPIQSLNPVSRTLEDVYISTTRPEKVPIQ
ncbi:MAG TPA: ABC transporter ATP-binding protein [Ktedonobacteraceae bacterium]|nr:ABC transporter ATP-binding protein [Ktedonobacteraceae bacterium]